MTPEMETLYYILPVVMVLVGIVLIANRTHKPIALAIKSEPLALIPVVHEPAAYRPDPLAELRQMMEDYGFVSNGRAHKVSLRVVSRELGLPHPRKQRTHNQARGLIRRLGYEVRRTANPKLVVIHAHAR